MNMDRLSPLEDPIARMPMSAPMNMSAIAIADSHAIDPALGAVHLSPSIPDTMMSIGRADRAMLVMFSSGPWSFKSVTSPKC